LQSASQSGVQRSDGARTAAPAPARAGVALRLPEHCTRPAARSREADALQRLLRRSGLVSVCEEARCPNRGGCWAQGHVTFMLLGSVCTRACRFCAVATGLPPAPPDAAEPARIAHAVALLSLRHVVLTSVNRDELPDGGAAHFAATLRAIRAACPQVTTEVLTPDFQGKLDAVAQVCAAAPDVYNHNVETVPRLYRRVRPGASFSRSLRVLAQARRLGPDTVLKSGFMVGLGESREEVAALLGALREAGVESVTVGQYLRPSLAHLPVERYWALEEFEAVALQAHAQGFAQVASAPLVRSSYNAAETFAAIRAARARADDEGDKCAVAQPSTAAE
jgi:lipoyl synthase